MSGLIPQNFINDLIESADIVEIIGSRLELKKAGRNFQGLCPFHNEKTPSFSVSPEKQFFHCFGCKESGTVLTFLMKYENLDFVEAIEATDQLGNVTSQNAMLTEISVKDDGRIEATYGLDTKVEVGKIQLADFINEFGLQNIGSARFQETGESGNPTFGAPKEGTLGKLQAGFLEKSNTDITDEIVLMLRTQQAFNGCSKMMQSDIDVTKKLSAR